MEKFTEILQLKLNLLGLTLSFNVKTIIMTWIVMAALIVFALLARKNMGIIPNPFQVVAELLIGAFYNLCVDTLEDERLDFTLICPLKGICLVLIVFKLSTANKLLKKTNKTI